MDIFSRNKFHGWAGCLYRPECSALMIQENCCELNYVNVLNSETTKRGKSYSMNWLFSLWSQKETEPFFFQANVIEIWKGEEGASQNFDVVKVIGTKNFYMLFYNCLRGSKICILSFLVYKNSQRCRTTLAGDITDLCYRMYQRSLKTKSEIGRKKCTLSETPVWLCKTVAANWKNLLFTQTNCWQEP